MPELCKSPVRKETPQAIRAIQIAQNAMLMSTVAASMTTNEVFLIFHFLSKAKLKAKGRLSPQNKTLSKS